MSKDKEGKLSKSYVVVSPKEGVAVKDIDMTKRIVTGFFNSFNYFDSHSDVLIMGSTKRSISDRGPVSNAVAKIKHALFHDLQLLPGKIEVLEEKTIDGVSGLYFETRMAETTLGNDTLINYQEKVYDNHSIGFRYKNLEFHEADTDGFDRVVAMLINPGDAIDKGYLWEVKEIELFEGSTVPFGANELTPSLGVKSDNPVALQMKLVERIQRLGKQLKGGTQSDGMLKNFQIELMQLEQMFVELDLKSSVDTLKEKARQDALNNSEQEKKIKFLY
ncbi:MAG: HK97 family phage prohead protease [Promethearchaeota archaeon]